MEEIVKDRILILTNIGICSGVWVTFLHLTGVI